MMRLGGCGAHRHAAQLELVHQGAHETIIAAGRLQEAQSLGREKSVERAIGLTWFRGARAAPSIGAAGSSTRRRRSSSVSEAVANGE
jgi:hypothetical protein